MIAIATPVSQLFADSSYAELIASLSDALEVRGQFVAFLRGEMPVLYHSEQSIIGPMNFGALAEDIGPLLAEGRLRILSLHALSCYENPSLKDGIFQSNGRRLPKHELLGNAMRNVEHLRKRHGSDIVIAVENNNYFRTGAYADITEPEFLADLTATTGSAFLLDLAHARISAHNMGVDPDDYSSSLPLNHTAQLHLSGYGTEGNLWRDAHDVLSDSQWAEAEELLPCLPNLQYVTLEYYRDPMVLLEMTSRLRSMLQRHSVFSARNEWRGP